MNGTKPTGTEVAMSVWDDAKRAGKLAVVHSWKVPPALAAFAVWPVAGPFFVTRFGGVETLEEAREEYAQWLALWIMFAGANAALVFLSHVGGGSA